MPQSCLRWRFFHFKFNAPVANEFHFVAVEFPEIADQARRTDKIHGIFGWVVLEPVNPDRAAAACFRGDKTRLSPAYGFLQPSNSGGCLGHIHYHLAKHQQPVSDRFRVGAVVWFGFGQVSRYPIVAVKFISNAADSMLSVVVA